MENSNTGRAGIRSLALFAFLFFGSKETFQAVDLCANRISSVRNGCVAQLTILKGQDRIAQGVKGMLPPYISSDIGKVPGKIWNLGEKSLPYIVNFYGINALNVSAPSGKEVNELPLSFFLESPKGKTVPDHQTNETGANIQKSDLGWIHWMQTEQDVPWWVVVGTCLLSMSFGALLNWFVVWRPKGIGVAGTNLFSANVSRDLSPADTGNLNTKDARAGD